MARDQDEKAFKDLIDKNTYDQTHFYTRFLKKQVAMIELTKNARACCEKAKEKKDEEKKEEAR